MSKKILIDKLKQIENAPEKGYVLAYFRNEVLFKSYKLLSDIKTELQNREEQELLELHLFNEEREYRCVYSRVSNGIYRVIEYVAKDFPKEGEDDVYVEEVSLETEQDEKVLTVLNHIKYSDETGMAVIDDYRLVVREAYAEK